MSTGVIFRAGSCGRRWGSATAEPFSARSPPGKTTLVVLLTLLALILPVSIYLIRATRSRFSIISALSLALIVSILILLASGWIIWIRQSSPANRLVRTLWLLGVGKPPSAMGANG
jgi:hypothetical protein